MWSDQTHALSSWNELELALIGCALESEEGAVDALEDIDCISEDIDR